jgi:hypothetical protein
MPIDIPLPQRPFPGSPTANMGARGRLRKNAILQDGYNISLGSYWCSHYTNSLIAKRAKTLAKSRLRLITPVTEKRTVAPKRRPNADNGRLW